MNIDMIRDIRSTEALQRGHMVISTKQLENKADGNCTVGVLYHTTIVSRGWFVACLSDVGGNCKYRDTLMKHPRSYQTIILRATCGTFEVHRTSQSVFLSGQVLLRFFSFEKREFYPDSICTRPIPSDGKHGDIWIRKPRD